MTTQSVENIIAKNVAIARAAYQACVTKDGRPRESHRRRFSFYEPPRQSTRP
jgi:hypothetical protein